MLSDCCETNAAIAAWSIVNNEDIGILDNAWRKGVSGIDVEIDCRVSSILIDGRGDWKLPSRSG